MANSSFWILLRITILSFLKRGLSHVTDSWTFNDCPWISYEKLLEIYMIRFPREEHISTFVYYKVTDSHSYLNFAWSHPSKCKLPSSYRFERSAGIKMIATMRPQLRRGDSAYERGGDARQKFWIKPLKETDLGVAQAFFFWPLKETMLKHRQHIYIYIFFFFNCNPSRGLHA